MPALPKHTPGTATQIMNMNQSRSGGASTISTFFNPIKKTLNIKKRLNKHGTNALFRAISAENWELVCTICDTKPYKAEKWHNAVGFFDAHRSSKILPLHQACIFQPTKEAIVHIIQAYPTALQSKESGYGRVPLHIACHSNASIESIQILVSHRPSASTEQDDIGRVPLHYALSNGASYDIVKILLNAATEVIGPQGRRTVCSMTDFNGWLPIHVACFMGVSPHVLREIVSAYPDAVDVATKKRSTPMSLVKGLAMSEERKEQLQSILQNKGRSTIRVGAVRSNLDQVVRMSDETCSKGVTLEIDEDETSSLSSMETSRTAFTKKSRSFKRQTYEYRAADLNQQSVGMARTTSSKRSAKSRRPKPSELPTHSAYDQEITEEEEEEPVFYELSNTYFPPEQDRRKESGSNLKSDSHQTAATKSYVSTDDEGSCEAIFQPITSTAAFC